MKNYRFVGKTSKEAFLIKGINVFNERWIHEDASGYWLFFVEV